MAFTGTATVVEVGNRTQYITGLSLAASAAGTIGNNGGSSEVDLPSGSAALSQAAIVNIQGADTLLKVGYASDEITITNTSGSTASGSIVIQVHVPHSATS